jgi:hypothetical protein
MNKLIMALTCMVMMIWFYAGALAAPMNAQWLPTVAYSPAARLYLVVWYEFPGDDSNVLGVRIKPTGVVVDRTPIAIGGSHNWATFPKVASDGVDFFVVWDEAPRGGNHDIWGARVQASTGTVLDPKPIFIGTAGVDWGRPAIAWNGQQYYVAWKQWTPAGIRMAGTLVSRGGAPRIRLGATISSQSFRQLSPFGAEDIEPSVAALGDDFLVVWNDVRNGLLIVSGTPVSGTGIVRRPGGITISRSSSTAWRPVATAAADRYWVVWQDYRRGALAAIYGTPVTAAGTPLGIQDVALVFGQGAALEPTIAARPDGTLLLSWSGFSTNSAGGFDISAQPLKFYGRVGATFLLSAAPQDQYYPAIASDGASFLVAWMDVRRSPGDTSISGALAYPQGVRVPDFLIRD